jgi:guanylate kinase
VNLSESVNKSKTSSKTIPATGIVAGSTPSRRRQGILFVISGPSGVGKTSLCRHIVAQRPDMIQSVSYTTRAPRSQERDGREYHFVSHSTFERLLANDSFLEWAEVHGNLYGTSRQQISRAIQDGLDVLLAIDVQGAMQLRASTPNAVFILLTPPSWHALTARLEQRGSETLDTQKQRLAVARQELDRYTEYDYVVCNDQFTTAVHTLQSIITAERHLVKRLQIDSVDDLLSAPLDDISQNEALGTHNAPQ